MSEAGLENCRPSGIRRLIWLPIPVFIILAVLFSGFHQYTNLENQVLLATLNTFFLGSVLLLIAGLAAREYVLSGSPGVLLMGCGALSFGVAGLVAGLMMSRVGATLAFHNLAVCFSGACFVAAAAACLYFKQNTGLPARFHWLLLASYGGILAGLVILVQRAWTGGLPLFYTLASGPTSLRQTVMGVSVAEFTTAALGFGVLYGRRRILSLLWHSLGLGLIAIGLLLVALVPPGTLIGWLGRTSQYLGSVYLLIAILFEGRGNGGVGLALELAYRESEERYHALVDLLPDAVLVHTRGKCRFANKACLKLFGVTMPGGLIGRDLLDLVHPEDRARVGLHLMPVPPEAAAGLRTEFRLNRLTGTVAVAEMTSGPVRYEGKAAGLVILRDITERQAREADLRRLNRALNATSASDSTMMRAVREDDYLPEVCRIVGDCGYSQVWIGYVDEGRDPEVRPVAWAGFERADLDRLIDAWKKDGSGGNPAAECLLKGQTVLVRTPPGNGFGFAATLALPLLEAGRAWGVLVIHAAEADAFAEEEIALLAELSHDLAYGVGAIRLRESLLQSAEALRQSEERHRRLVEASPDAILVSRDNRIAYVNEALLRMVGTTGPELVVGKTLLELFDAAYHDLVRSRLGVRVEGQSLSRLEGKLKRADGSLMDVDVASISYESPDGPSLLVVLRDITSRKRFEQALRRSTLELSRSNQDLAQFAHVASHDLKEPLRMVTGFLSLLKDHYAGRLDEKGSEYIRFSVDAAVRMQRLIDDLLSYSRVGRTGSIERVRAAEAMDAALKNLKLSVEESGALITCGDLPEVPANFLELTQLFQNLLGNAIKFRGAARPEISVDVTRENGHWVFKVRDNGIGIDSRFADRVFQIFNRLHTADEYPGTGIGLAICKKVVERHGGRIWVESGVGRGSTFFFTLPAESALMERVG